MDVPFLSLSKILIYGYSIKRCITDLILEIQMLPLKLAYYVRSSF